MRNNLVSRIYSVINRPAALVIDVAEELTLGNRGLDFHIQLFPAVLVLFPSAQVAMLFRLHCSNIEPSRFDEGDGETPPHMEFRAPWDAVWSEIAEAGICEDAMTLEYILVEMPDEADHEALKAALDAGSMCHTTEPFSC